MPPGPGALLVHVEGDAGSAKEENDFPVATAWVQYRSTFFAKAIVEHLGSGHAFLRVDLMDVTPEVFRYYYLDCVCANNAKLETDQDLKSVDKDGYSETISGRIMRKYCQGYMLAEKLGDCAAANMIMDALINCSVVSKTLLSADLIAWIYDSRNEVFEGSSSVSNLRKLAVDMWAFAAKWDGK